MSVKITEGTADRIKVPDGKRDVFVYDLSLSGFYLRVYANGRASYGVDYYIAGKRRRMSLGPAAKGALGAARKNAAEILAKARLGADTLGERKAVRERGEKSFGKLVMQFLDDRESRLASSTHIEWKRYLERYMTALHASAVSAIERRDLITEIDRIAGQRGAVTADRCKEALSAFFAWCVECQHIEANPALGISRRSQKQSRSRILEDAELKEVWRHAGDGPHGLIVKLLVLTGQRRAEIGSLQWSEIDQKKKLLVLASERAKNRREHIVPLSTAAMSILAQSPHWEGQGFIFGQSGHSGYSGWSRSKERLDHRIAKARQDQGQAAMPEWTLHDLRRTAASGMARLGVALPVIERALNHVSGSFGGIVGVYQRHTFEKEMREALELWAEHVLSVCEASPASSLAEQATD
jgi:integrase